MKDAERLCVGERVLNCRLDVSDTGASPKIKNLMNAPISTTTDSWPRRKPWVKERLDG